MEAYLANSALGQPIFEFRSVSCLSILEGISVEKSKLRWGRINLTFKKDEKCELVAILRWIPWGVEAFQFYSPVNSGEAGWHRSKPKVVLGLDQYFGFFCFEANVLVYHYIIIIDVILPLSLQLYLSYMKLIKLAIVASHCRHYTHLKLYC